VTSVLGTAEPSSRCHGSRRSEPAHWLRAEEEEKARGVGVARPAPATVVRSAARGHGHAARHRGGPQGGRDGGKVKVISFSLKWEACEGQSRESTGKWAAFSFTLNSSSFAFFVVFGFEIGQSDPFYSLPLGGERSCPSEAIRVLLL
jgi:hypothetical protein